MPSSRHHRAYGDGPLLSPWRQEKATGAKAKLWLYFRRGVATLLALGLCGLLMFWLLRPLFLPRTFFVYFGADETVSVAVPPVGFVYEDFAEYTKTSPALSRLERGDRSPLLFMRLSSGESVNKLIEVLGDSAASERDTLLIAVSAHGIVSKDGPCLVGAKFDPNQDSGLARVEDLLRRLNSLPGAAKVLLIDSSRLDYAPRLGVLGQAFPHALEETYRRLDEEGAVDSVSVLCASSPGERSHVSRAMRRSVFGYFTALGLQGAADDDGDGEVHLEELHEYVRLNVGGWVRWVTDSAETQSTMLLRPSGGDDAFLLSTARLPSVQAEQAIQGQIGTANSKESRESVMAKLADGVSDRVSEFGVTPFTWLANKGSGLVKGGDEEDAKPEEAADDQSRDIPSLFDEEAWRRNMDDAWKQTKKVEELTPSPSSYAPHLWRRHLDRLVWLDAVIRSGEPPLDTAYRLDDELQAIREALQNFDEPEGAVGGVIKEIRDERRRPPVAPGDAPSLGLAEGIAESDWKSSLPEPLAAFLVEYDRWLVSNDDSGFDRLDEVAEEALEGRREWSAARQSFYELQLVDELRGEVESPGGGSLADAKRLLKTRRAGERVAAELLAGQGWGAEAIAEADAFRLEAERLYFTHAAAGWTQRVSDRLDDANESYDRAREQIETVSQAQRLHDEMLLATRDYLRLADLTAGEPGADEIRASVEGLFQTLRQVRRALDQPGTGSVSTLEELAKRLRGVREDFQKNLNGRIGRKPLLHLCEPLLNLTLLSHEQRDEVCKASRSAEQARISEKNLSSSSSDEARAAPNDLRYRERLENQLDLEEALLNSLAATQGSDSGTSADLPWSYLNDRCLKLATRLGGLPAKANPDDDSDPSLPERSNRNERLQKLRRSAAALSLVTADLVAVGEGSSEEQQEAEAVLDRLHKSRWCDLFTSLRRRCQAASRDAQQGSFGREELSRLDKQAAAYGRLARSVEEGSRQSDPPVPRFEFGRLSPGEVRLLGSDKSTQLRATLSSTGRGDADIWVVAQYDADLISVELEGESVEDAGRLVLEHQLLRRRVVNGGGDAGYPYHPRSRGYAKSLTLTDNTSRELTFLVNRLRAGGGDARLVLKAIGEHEFSRLEAPVRMPGREVVRVLRRGALGGEDVALRGADTVFLYPGRVTDTELRVSNLGDEPRTLVARLYSPSKTPENLYIPPGFVSNEVSRSVLRGFGRPTAIATSDRIENLQRGADRSLYFTFRPPPSPALPTDPNAGHPFSLPHGLLIVLEDEITKEKTIRYLRYEVYEPRGYVNAQADYDHGSRQLLVTLRPGGETASGSPTGRVSAELLVDRDYISDLGSNTLKGQLQNPSRPLILRVSLNGKRPSDFDSLEGSELPIAVSVDGYPRAFRFLIPEGTGVRRYSPITGTTSIRVVSPRDKAEFKARESLPAVVEVDTPTGFFSEADRSVVIGIDNEYPKREFNGGERPLPAIRSDRDVRILAGEPTDSGSLSLKPIVSDFRVELDTDGMNGEVNVLAEIRDGVEREYDLSEIAIDTQHPRVGLCTPNQEGDVLKVEIKMMEDLTGIQLVEAGLQPTGAEALVFTPGKKIADATFNADGTLNENETWIVNMKLDFKKLSPGEHRLLVRATDNVTNSHPDGAFFYQDLRIEAPAEPDDSGGSKPPRKDPEKEVKPKPARVTVTGRATYGRVPITGLTVKLTGEGGAFVAKVGSDGKTFEFSKVPVGDYELSAQAYAGVSVPLKKVMNVTIKGRPGGTHRLGEVKVR